jgi:hypothetical protein
MPFINFEEVEQLATIEELADMPGLKTKRYNANQIRCSCPIHGGEHKLSRSFDPVAFAAKLAFTDEATLAVFSLDGRERRLRHSSRANFRRMNMRSTWRFMALIIAMRANIAGPASSATNSASIAACHSSASCCPLGNLVNSAASRRVISLLPGNSMGSANLPIPRHRLGRAATLVAGNLENEPAADRRRRHGANGDRRRGRGFSRLYRLSSGNAWLCQIRGKIGDRFCAHGREHRQSAAGIGRDTIADQPGAARYVAQRQVQPRTAIEKRPPMIGHGSCFSSGLTKSTMRCGT